MHKYNIKIFSQLCQKVVHIVPKKSLISKICFHFKKKIVATQETCKLKHPLADVEHA